MINILIHWENADWINDRSRIRTIMKFYTLTMKAYGIKRLDVVTGESIGWTDSEIVFNQFKTFEDALSANKGRKFIVLEKADNYPDKKFVDITKYDHPEDNAVYLIGSDYGQIDLSALDNPDLVTIKTINSVPLWSHVALGIMIFSRFNQWR